MLRQPDSQYTSNESICIPCDPGLPGADCIPESEWPPARTTAPRSTLGETAPQVALPPTTAEEEPVLSCPEGQVLDEETNLCVLKEPEADEQQEEEQDEPEQEEQKQPQQEEAE